MYTKSILTSLCVLLAVATEAQNVGIGTTTPHASAALHVNSTTRGFLPPRVTSTQRTNIATPTSGLMVYDTEVDRMYVYEEGVWRYMLSNEVWANNATSVYQSAKNVGIGNASPTEKLHVTGNIRLTGEVMTTGAGMTINNLTGTLTFQGGGDDKGFVQLSGDNLRVGVHSTNTNGKVVFRTGGLDRIFINSDGYMGFNIADPLARIDLNGNMRISGKMQTTTTGAAHMLPVAYGQIQANAIISAGSSGNFTASRISDGYYRITSDDFNTNTVIVVTCTGVGVTIGAYQGGGPTSCEVNIRQASDGSPINAWFNFVAFTR
jgi:hypothetical protein